jgi:phosphoglycolate phosphatase
MHLVIFDFDGTIADSTTAIAECMNEALVAIGHPSVEPSATQALIGLPLRQIFVQLAPQLTDGEVDQGVAAYRDNYAEVSKRHTSVFDGMIELIRELRGRERPLAIATGKSTHGAHRSLARLSIDEALFDIVLGHDAVKNPKPHPDMVEHILTKLDTKPSDAVVVGDTTFDITMAKRAGVASCGVTWGSHREAALRDAGARWVVDTRAALHTLLLG